MTAVSEELIRYPIVPDEGDFSGATSIEVINIFLTVDASLFDAVDQDPVAAGIQPFTLGTNGALSAADVDQAAYIDINTGDLRLDFIYDVGLAGTGLSFFDGEEVLASANLRAKSISGGATTATTISLDNSGTRVSKMIDGNFTLGTAIPAPTAVDIVNRAEVTGTVPLQGRTSSADTVTFILRESGDFVPVDDTVFEAANDTDANTPGVQVVTTGVNGDFTLTALPTGRFILTAQVPRHLAGHDTLNVTSGLDVSGFQPTLDGDGIDRSALLAGDAAGFNDSTGASVPDNFINAADISAIDASLFLQLGDPGFDTFADINRDNIVNGADRSFATANQTDNTGVGGIKPVFPTFKQALAQGDNTKARLLISGYPTEEVSAGEVFDVTVAIEGAASVRTYEFHLGFDPSKLAVEDVVPGSLFENYTADMGGKVREGDFGIVNSILGLTPVGASGEATLATVRFRAISRSSETMLELTDALLIDVDHEGATPELAGEAMIVLSNDPIVYHDAAGQTVHGLILADADPKVDFNDFVAFAQSFGTSAGMESFDLRADFNGDDTVNFTDFVMLRRASVRSRWTLLRRSVRASQPRPLV